VLFLDFSIIEFLKHIFLGIVQGITEVLPISSSGHVELIKALIGLECDDNVIFLILLNTGSLATFIIIYFKRLIELSKSFFVYIFIKTKREEHHENFIYLSKVLIACIPAGLFGLFLKPIFEENLADYAILISGIGLLITATVIYFVSTNSFRKDETNVSWWDTLFIGLAQAVAIVPGVSRSGMTTSMALKRGNGITTALNFSFLMYIFISIATTGLLVVDLVQDGSSISGAQYTYYLFAFFAAMIFTYLAYKLIFNIFKSGKLRYFSYYCFAVGLLGILLFII
jgi:undecaprenyl-diphosphatase